VGDRLHRAFEDEVGFGKARSISPRSTAREHQIAAGSRSWIGGAPGAAASSTVNIAGSGSYSTFDQLEARARRFPR
jgi:hypothetical protein